MQSLIKALDALRCAFEEHFNSCVAPVANIASQAMFNGGAVDEGAKADALNNAQYAEFYSQTLDLAYFWVKFSLIHF
jgi:hypothetical protein